MSLPLFIAPSKKVKPDIDLDQEENDSSEERIEQASDSAEEDDKEMCMCCFFFLMNFSTIMVLFSTWVKSWSWDFV